jgi:hypothetical protein
MQSQHISSSTTQEELSLPTNIRGQGMENL